MTTCRRPVLHAEWWSGRAPSGQATWPALGGPFISWPRLFGARGRPGQGRLDVAEALHVLMLFDQDEIAVRQDLPDIARWLAGSGNRTGEMLAIRWERIDFVSKTAYVDHNVVWIKGKGLTLNDGKTEMAERGIALADWLVDMLLDRRRRVAAIQGSEPDQLTGWVFPNINGDFRYASNLRRDWRAFRDRHQDWGTGSPRAPSVALLPPCSLTNFRPVRQVTCWATRRCRKPQTRTSAARWSRAVRQRSWPCSAS